MKKTALDDAPRETRSTAAALEQLDLWPSEPRAHVVDEAAPQLVRAEATRRPRSHHRHNEITPWWIRD